MRLPLLAAVAALAVSAVAAPASTVNLGTPTSDPVVYADANSTNALNYAEQTPGRVGQPAPYVSSPGNGPGYVDLFFYNPASGGAFFEYRLDGIATGTTTHPVIGGDTIHAGFGVGFSDPARPASRSEQVYASQFVDVRLALGGERDWDFGWTRFEVGAVPLPAGLPLMLAAIAALGLAGRAAARRS